jgi:hypothetical protein
MVIGSGMSSRRETSYAGEDSVDSVGYTKKKKATPLRASYKGALNSTGFNRV